MEKFAIYSPALDLTHPLAGTVAAAVAPKLPANDLIRRLPIHPLGAAGGGLTRAALGSAPCPMGAVTGAALGATFGAIADKGIAEGIDPESEQAYGKSATGRNQDTDAMRAACLHTTSNFNSTLDRTPITELECMICP